MSGYLDRPAPSGLADVVEIILDKGVVIDAYVRVSLLGIELLTVDARIVVASVDTYLRFAEATNRLDLSDKGGKDLADIAEGTVGPVVENVASKVVEKKVDNVLEAGASKVEGAIEKGAEVVERAAGRVGDVVDPGD